MNRQQFLSELNQYLSVFSAAERESVISYYSAKFDAAGADGEAALLLELGTVQILHIKMMDLKLKMKMERIIRLRKND